MAIISAIVAATAAPLGPALTILESKLGLLILGFILTTVAGGLISSWLQRASWARQTRVDLFRKRYEEGSQFLDQFSRAVGNRFFQLQRFLWAIADAQEREEQVRQIASEYFKVVGEWNFTYWMNRNKIRLLVGDDFANAFLDYRDESNLEHPASLHYHFVKAHRYLLNAKRRQIDANEAQAVIDDLNWVCSPAGRIDN